MNLGLAYRHQLPLEQSQARHSLDCLEITADEVFDVSGARREQIERLRRTFTLLVHSLDLSIGSVARPPQTYLDNVARVLELTGAPYHSDHLAVTSTATRSLGQFSPVWYTEDMLEVVSMNVIQVQRFTGLPLVLETITKPFDVPGATMSEADFFARLCAMTGCGILLDITNVYINSRNLGGSAESFVQQLPSEHIREIHLVGYGTDRQARLVDDHAHAIQPEIWQLYEYALSLATPEYVIIERDASFPRLEDLLAEVARARGVPAAATSGARAQGAAEDLQ